LLRATTKNVKGNAQMNFFKGLSARNRRYLLGSGTAILILLFVFVNTTFLSDAEVAADAPKEFSVTDFASKNLPLIAADIQANAVDMAIVAAAADKDIVAAGAEFGRDLGNKSFVFAVKTTAKVKLVDENFIVLNVPGAPAQDTFNIPIGLALSGNPLRDVTGKITFGDFYDQTQYQDVANALKDLVRSTIIDQLDLQNLTGKTLSIYGAWNNGPLKNVYNIQPTSIVVK
jgi:predicted lipoprotein